MLFDFLVDDADVLSVCFYKVIFNCNAIIYSYYYFLILTLSGEFKISSSFVSTDSPNRLLNGFLKRFYKRKKKLNQIYYTSTQELDK